MQTHPAKRVSIIIEADKEQTLRAALSAAGVTGLTVLPVLGGSGRSGEWSRDGQVSRGQGLVQVVFDPLTAAVLVFLERVVPEPHMPRFDSDAL